MKQDRELQAKRESAAGFKFDYAIDDLKEVWVYVFDPEYPPNSKTDWCNWSDWEIWCDGVEISGLLNDYAKKQIEEDIRAIIMRSVEDAETDRRLKNMDSGGGYARWA